VKAFSSEVPDPEIVGRLSRLTPVPYTGLAYRHMAPRYSDRPLSGEGARQVGGRWNPRGVAALYLAEGQATVTAELRRLAERQQRSLADFLPRTLIEYELELQAVLNLRDTTTLDAAGLTHSQLRGDDQAPCREMGEAARYAGYEAVIAPSAAGEGTVIAVYIDRLRNGSIVRDVKRRELTELTRVES
jgi:RES domain-containing protein